MLGSIGAFLAVRAFRSLESAGVDFVQGGDAPVTGDAAVDGTVVGDCVASGSTSSCSSPHELEVFHVVPTSGSAYPTFDRLFDVSDGECVTAFEQYVGIDYYESEFWLDAYAPSESAWNAGDQSIRCAAYDPLGDMTESVRGIGR